MKELTESELGALVVLLGDDSPSVTRVARQALKEAGNRALPFLRAGLGSADSQVSTRCADLLREMEAVLQEQEIRNLAALPDVLIDLEEGALLIVRTRYPDADAAACKAHLDDLGERVKRLLTPAMTMEDRIGAMNAVLFGQEQFRGNVEDYADPDNCYLNRVLERRTGKPILLSILYILVGRRAGLSISGVNMPQHFIVRYDEPQGTAYVDPFNQGMILSRAECLRRMAAAGETPRFSVLLPVPARLILVRVLSNLVGDHQARGDAEQARRLLRYRNILWGRDDTDGM